MHSEQILLTTGCFKKNVRMFVCWISPKPINRFLNRFFLLKTEIHMKISNTEPIFCYFMGLRYLQNKMRFRNRQVHIHTDLKWSSQYQSCLEMTRLAPDCPGHTLRGPQRPPVAPTGLSGGVLATQGPVGASQSHSDAVRTTSCQCEYVLEYFGTWF